MGTQWMDSTSSMSWAGLEKCRNWIGTRRWRPDYVDAVNARKSALIVSPTHLEADRITSEIRQTFQQQGRLGADERTFATLHNAQLTEAERADPVNVLPGDVLVFHQNAKGFQKGQHVLVGEQPLPASEAAGIRCFIRTVFH